DLGLGPERGPLAGDREEVDLPRAGVDFEDRATVFGGQELALVDHDATRAAVAGTDQLGDVTRYFLAPVPRTPRRLVPIMAAVHRPDHPAAPIAVVVVVAGENVAERVQASFVVVPLPVAD